jgi:hypothetical protein
VSAWIYDCASVRRGTVGYRCSGSSSSARRHRGNRPRRKGHRRQCQSSSSADNATIIAGLPGTSGSTICASSPGSSTNARPTCSLFSRSSVVPPVVTSGRPGQKYSLVELLESKELHEFGQTLTRAYLFSGEAPSLTALEWADRNVALPDETTGDVAKFHEGVRQRIERQLREQTGAPHIGEWIKHARRAASLSEVQAAQDAELPVPAYQALERGRMPVWRTPAQPFARLCRRLAIDGQLLVRWMSLTLHDETQSPRLSSEP